MSKARDAAWAARWAKIDALQAALNAAKEAKAARIDAMRAAEVAALGTAEVEALDEAEVAAFFTAGAWGPEGRARGEAWKASREAREARFDPAGAAEVAALGAAVDSAAAALNAARAESGAISEAEYKAQEARQNGWVLAVKWVIGLGLVVWVWSLGLTEAKISSWIFHNITFVVFFLGFFAFGMTYGLEQQAKEIKEIHGQIAELQNAMRRRFGERWKD